MKKVTHADSHDQKIDSNAVNLLEESTEKENRPMKSTAAKGTRKMLATLQEAREGMNEFIDPTKSQEILDEYFFGRSMRRVKRLYKSSLAQGKRA